MSKRSTQRNAEKTKELDINTLNFYFDFEPEFVFAYSPDGMREVCEASNAVMRVLVSRMRKMLEAAPDSPAISRPGFTRPLSDKEWLRKMIVLARGEEAFNYDVDETCYSEFDRIRQAKLKANEERRTKRLAADAAIKGCSPVAGAEKSTDDKTPATNQPVTKYFLRGFRNGQLQISNFILRCCILCVGARGKARQKWTDDAPLIVDDVSGYKCGDIVISYVGEELRLKDIVLWSKILQMAAPRPLGTKVNISKAQLLHARGGTDGSNSFRAAKDEINRLQKAHFDVTIHHSPTINAIAEICADDKSVQDAKETGMLSISFHLIGETTTSGRLWTIHVEPIVRMLFGKSLSSWFDERVYRSIQGDYAKRLYLLYYSHAQCYPLTPAELRKYLGSTMADDSKFKDAMDAAHDELAANGIIEKDWKFESSGRRYGALAYVVTRPTVENGDALDEIENAELEDQ